jgi:hypothetical protein
MIHIKKKVTPRKISLTLGHFLLFLWISEDDQRKQLFEKCIAGITTHQDSELFTRVLNQCARRCWDEFKFLYEDEANGIDQGDALHLYEVMRKTTNN